MKYKFYQEISSVVGDTVAKEKVYNQNEWVKFFVLKKKWTKYFESVQHLYILFYYFLFKYYTF